MASGAPPTIAEGSSTVSFNSKPAARIGDKISNGGSISLGSGNVFIGDGSAIISISDSVNVSFGDGCMVYLGCDPPGGPSKSTRNNALSNISSNVQAAIAALDTDMENISTAIKAESAELYVEEKSSLQNFADEDLDDELHDVLDPLGPVGAEISASAEGLGELGAAIVSGLKLLNSAKAAEAEGGPMAGNAEIQQCKPISIGDKIRGQMKQKGWTEEQINDVLNKPTKTRATRDTRNNRIGLKNDDPAIAYFDSEGNYAVQNDITGDIVQVSDKNKTNWTPANQINTE